MPSPAATPEQRTQELTDFVARLVAEVQPLYLRLNEAVWQANVTGEPRFEEESGRLEVQIRAILARRESMAFLRGLVDAGGVPDPLLQRQLTLLLNDHRANQIPHERIEQIVRLEKSLESRFNNFRAVLDGTPVTDNRLREVLRDSNDGGERQRAWAASKQIGAEVAPDLRRLVELRNQAARDQGFANYYAMMLELDELDETELFGMLDELEQQTRPTFASYKQDLDARLARRFGVAPAELRPWHYGDPFFQEAPVEGVPLDPWFAGKSLEELTERFFSGVGFAVHDLLERADLYEKPGKCQHAFCMCMDRGPDIRVLCNVRDNEYWMGTMLHEFGHAVYDKYIDRSLPYVLRGPAHTLCTEASAMLFGRLSKNAAWLNAYAAMPADEARRAGELLGRAVREQLLVQTRWNLVMCHMERALYNDPGQDLDGLWWHLVQRYQNVAGPGRSAPDWASKIHFSVAPVYYHNYLMGEMMASQLQRYLLREVVGNGPGAWDRFVRSPEVGGYLIEHLYRAGKSRDWREAMRHATGRSLEATAFADELAGRS